MQKIHTFLVTAYLLGGLMLMATTPWQHLRAEMQTSGGTLLQVESLHASADDPVWAAATALDAAESAAASRHLFLGIMLFTAGGFIHAYQTLREERPVRITVKKKKPRLLYWLEMKV